MANNTDSSRTTTSKTVTGAINELNSGKINKTSIVNNLLATVAGSVLDAMQGKALNDKVVTKSTITTQVVTLTSGTGNIIVTVTGLGTNIAG